MLTFVFFAARDTLFFNIDVPIFNRDQGEIARTSHAIRQAQETQSATAEGVLTDVINAYEPVRTNAQASKFAPQVRQILMSYPQLTSTSCGWRAWTSAQPPGKLRCCACGPS